MFIMQSWYWLENSMMSWKEGWHLKFPPSRTVCGTSLFFSSVSVSLFLLLMFYWRILVQKAIPSSCWRTKISCLCGSLYAQHNHKVLIVLENKPKQIPELRGIFSMVGAEEVLNTSSRWGAGHTGNCLGFDCNHGFERLEMLGKNNQTYGMH